MIFNRCKDNGVEKGNCLQTALKPLNIHLQKKSELQFTPWMIYKNVLKMDDRHKYKI